MDRHQCACVGIRRCGSDVSDEFMGPWKVTFFGMAEASFGPSGGKVLEGLAVSRKLLGMGVGIIGVWPGNLLTGGLWATILPHPFLPRFPFPAYGTPGKRKRETCAKGDFWPSMVLSVQRHLFLYAKPILVTAKL
jgi:hypothetical protein